MALIIHMVVEVQVVELMEEIPQVHIIYLKEDHRIMAMKKEMDKMEEMEDHMIMGQKVMAAEVADGMVDSHIKEPDLVQIQEVEEDHHIFLVIQGVIHIQLLFLKTLKFFLE